MTQLLSQIFQIRALDSATRQLVNELDEFSIAIESITWTRGRIKSVWYDASRIDDRFIPSLVAVCKAYGVEVAPRYI